MAIRVVCTFADAVEDLPLQSGAVNEPSSDAYLPHIVVHPVDIEQAGRPFRRVDILGQVVGRAYGPADVVEFMRRAGLDTALLDELGTVVEWRGGGPEEWQ